MAGELEVKLLIGRDRRPWGYYPIESSEVVIIIIINKKLQAFCIACSSMPELYIKLCYKDEEK
jgi:hypothetical protein